MEINGLPLHPLLVHAGVVLIPLAALAGLGFAVLPRWRDRLRWPTAIGAVLSLVLVQVLVVSGRTLMDSRHLHFGLVHAHEAWGLRLRLAALAFAVLAVVVTWLVRTPPPAPAVTVTLSALLALSAIAVLVLVFLTGEAGARAVWS